MASCPIGEASRVGARKGEGPTDGARGATEIGHVKTFVGTLPHSSLGEVKGIVGTLGVCDVGARGDR